MMIGEGLVGQGMIAMDVALFMSTIGAGAVNAFYLPACWRVSRGIAIMRILRLTGWLLLSTRYAAVLLTYGDLSISLPAAIGVMFLAAGEIYALFNRGKFVPL